MRLRVRAAFGQGDERVGNGAPLKSGGAAIDERRVRVEDFDVRKTNAAARRRLPSSPGCGARSALAWFALSLSACGASSPADPLVGADPTPGAPSSSAPSSSASAPIGRGAAPVQESTDPWAMPAGRLGRIRMVHGEVIAAFGADDPRFVGHMPEARDLLDGYVDAEVRDAGAHAAPAHVIGLPIDPARTQGGDGAPVDRYEVELGAAVEIHERYVVSNGRTSDELTARGFRVLRCGGAPPTVFTSPCASADVLVVGPVRVLDLPAMPEREAPEDVRATYASARRYDRSDPHVTSLRATSLDSTFGVWWVRAEGTSHVVWTRHPIGEDGFFLGVEPRGLFVAGDALLMSSLDEPLEQTVRPHLRVHELRAGHPPLVMALSSSH